MAKNCFVKKEPHVYAYMRNTSGAEVVAGEFCIIGGFAAVAQETIAANAWGNFLTGSAALIQTAELTGSEDTFGTPGQIVYWNNTDKSFSDTVTVGYYAVGQLNTAKASGVITFNKYEKAVIVASDVATLQAIVEANAALGGKFFMKTATLTSAAAATPVHILTDAEVGAGKKAYVSQVFLSVNGAVNWGTTATISIQDTAGSPVPGCTFDATKLVANSMHQLASSDFTLLAPIADGAGFTTAKGLDIAGNANGTGSDLIVTVFGCVK